MTRPLTLNLRTGTAQAGLLGPEFDGEPLAETRQPVRTQSAPFDPYSPDRRTRADDVRLEIVTDSGQGGLFEE